MKRGEVWWAALPDPAGSGPGLRRPVVIIQANPFNDSRIGTVIVAVITPNLALAAAPGNVRVTKSDSGLPQVSAINISQLLTLDRRLLAKCVKLLPTRVKQALNAGLHLVLAL
ncbi:PemK-like protein [mine drainage metagenome]|uniref:PemK-like protein n=1 Tax=mine drainage metagenome TaxID=410659 RepID=T1ANU1_9ZZZZ